MRPDGNSTRSRCTSSQGGAESRRVVSRTFHGSRFTTLGHLGIKAEVPTEVAFEPAEERRRHRPEIPLFHITVPDILRYAIREYMVNLDLFNPQALPLKKSPGLVAGIGQRHRTSGLRLRVSRDHFWKSPESA